MSKIDENDEDVIVISCVHAGGHRDRIQFETSGDELQILSVDDQEGDEDETYVYIPMDDVPALIIWLAARYQEYSKED